jgi:osmotically-inducible protein OsmY
LGGELERRHKPNGYQEKRMTRTKKLLAMSFLLAVSVALLSTDQARAASKSDDIKTVQQALKDKGYDSGEVDGVIGSQTRAAVRKFQKDYDLPVTGRLDDETLEKLGVEVDSPIDHFADAGKDVGQGGKAFGKGAQEMGGEVNEGKVGEGAKDLGKGAGDFGKKVGQAGKEVGQGVKAAVMPDKDTTPGSDDAIERDVKNRLAADPELHAADVDVDVDVDVEDGVVTLSGHMDTAELRDKAVRIAQSIAGVKSVTDELGVGNH